jgi:hypothetical protein
VDFRQTITALARRWYVAIPVFILVVGLIGVITVTTKHQYESTGTVLLRQPSLAQSGGKKGGGPPNPLLEFPDSLSTDAQLLIQSLNSPTAIATIAALGGTATFAAGNGGRSGPFIMVTADSLTPDPAAKTVALAFQYVGQELAQREKALNAPPISYLILDDVVAPTTPTLKIGGKSRLAGAAVIIAFAATLTATFLADAYLRRRAGRRRVQPLPAV